MQGSHDIDKSFKLTVALVVFHKFQYRRFTHGCSRLQDGVLLRQCHIEEDITIDRDRIRPTFTDNLVFVT